MGDSAGSSRRMRSRGTSWAALCGTRRLDQPPSRIASDPGRLARDPSPQPTTVVWILLDDRDAEAVRTEVIAGRHGSACGLLLNWAVELIPIAAAMTEPVRTV